jgi:hypothetical protein
MGHQIRRGLGLALVLSLAVVAPAGCGGSHYTILDRSTLQISDSARISAMNMVADARRFPQVAEHLALAQEVYQRQLYLLKERRNKIRSRRRTLGVVSFATMAAGALSTSAFAVAGDETRAAHNLELAALTGLVALGVGTATQVGSMMQEDTSSLDAKVRQLELLYDTMMERLRDLSRRAADPVCDPSTASCPVAVAPIDDLSARMGEVIEAFVSAALAITVRG